MTKFSDAVAEVTSYITGRVNTDDAAAIKALAEQYVWHGIEGGANDDGEMHAEIRSRDSYNGNPIPFTFSAVDED